MISNHLANQGSNTDGKALKSNFANGSLTFRVKKNSSSPNFDIAIEFYAEINFRDKNCGLKIGSIYWKQLQKRPTHGNKTCMNA